MRAAVLLLMLVAPAAGKDKPAAQYEVRIVPDPAYDMPKPGERVQAYSKQRGAPVYAAAGEFAFQELMKSLKAGDTIGIAALVEKKSVAILPDGANLHAIKYQLNRFMPEKTAAVEARVLDGPLAGQVVWVPFFDVTRLIEKRVKVIPKRGPISADAKAAIRYASAEEAERKALEDGKPPASALAAYQEVIDRYPDSTWAKEAEKKIKAIEAKAAKKVGTSKAKPKD